MIAVNSFAEALNASQPNVVTLVANTPAKVLVDRRDDGQRWVFRYIQNLTGGDLYVAFDKDVSLNGDQYHMIVSDRQQVPVPTLGFVSCWSVAGGKVAALEFNRPRI